MFLKNIFIPAENLNFDMSFLVFVQIVSPLGLIITVVTLQNIIAVLCGNVTLKTTSFCSLIITLITGILDTFMLRSDMLLHRGFVCEARIAFWTWESLSFFTLRIHVVVFTLIWNSSFSPEFTLHKWLQIT